MEFKFEKYVNECLHWSYYKKAQENSIFIFLGLLLDEPRSAHIVQLAKC